MQFRTTLNVWLDSLRVESVTTKSTHFVALPEYPRNSPHRAAWVSSLSPMFSGAWLLSVGFFSVPCPLKKLQHSKTAKQNHPGVPWQTPAKPRHAGRRHKHKGPHLSSQMWALLCLRKTRLRLPSRERRQHTTERSTRAQYYWKEFALRDLSDARTPCKTGSTQGSAATTGRETSRSP